MKSFFPNRIDRYILSEITVPVLGGALFFVFVFLLSQALRLAEFLITHRASLWDLFELISCIVLIFLPAVLPIAFLIGVMVGFGRLSTDSELVAMKAGGVSIYRMSLSPILLAVLTSVVSFKLATEWAPIADQRQSLVISRIANRKIVRSIQAGTFQADFFNLLMFAEQKDPKTERLKNVFIFDERNPSDPITIVAREGDIITAISKSELGAAIILRLFDGNLHKISSDSENYQKIDFGEYRVYLEIEGTEASSGERPRFLSSQQLQSSIKLLEQSPKPPKSTRKKTRMLREEYWKRYAISLSPLVLVFLGVGLGTLRTRAVRSSATLLSFVIIFSFYGILVGGQVLANRWGLPVSWGTQLPNIIGILAAWRAMRSAAW
jgi:LPS export ABC transporter permease LptF